jgi:hypothetical protein
MSVAAIKDSDIEAAAHMDDLDRAAKLLQDIAGITTGDVAGVCLNPKDWEEADTEERLKLLRAWLKTEEAYEAPH